MGAVALSKAQGTGTQEQEQSCTHFFGRITNQVGVKQIHGIAHFERVMVSEPQHFHNVHNVL